MRVAPSATVMPHVNWQAPCFRICRHSESMIATPHRPVFLTSLAVLARDGFAFEMTSKPNPFG